MTRSAAAEDPYADQVVAYVPVAPPSGFTDSARALGAPSGFNPAIPDNGSAVSLGAVGGAITLAFDTPITDDPANAFGMDCIVYSNAFWIGGAEQRRFQEPAAIEISRDANDNGLADDEWFLIPGSKGLPYTGGVVPTIAEAMGPGNEAPFDPGLLAGAIRNPKLFDSDSGNDGDEGNWGYADMSPTFAPYLDNYVRPDDPLSVGATPRSGGGDAFDIAWAIDAAGSPAGITEFDFIRITTFVDRNIMGLGAASCEVVGVADVAASTDVDNDGILDEYETRVAGTDPTRRESTVLALEIPAIEGGSPAGALLGAAAHAAGHRVRLFSAGQRTDPNRARSVNVDLVPGTAPIAPLPSGLMASGASLDFVASVSNFETAQINAAQITIHYDAIDIDGLDESSLEALRLVGGSYVSTSITNLVRNAAANVVTFDTPAPGTYLLVSVAGAGDDTSVGPQGAVSLTANPVTIIANPANTITITSGMIFDEMSMPVADGTLISVATTGGAITSTDADLSVPGVQVEAVGGIIAFTLSAPTLAGTANITVTSVQGAAFGELLYSFTPGAPAPPIRFRAGFRVDGDPVLTQLLSDSITDQFGNIVADGTMLTIVPEQTSITSGDADVVAPGHQVLVANGRADLLIETPFDTSFVRLSIFADAAQTELIAVQILTPVNFLPVPVASVPLVLLLGLLILSLGRDRIFRARLNEKAGRS